MKYWITVIDDSEPSVFSDSARNLTPVTVRRRTAVDFEVVPEQSKAWIKVERCPDKETVLFTWQGTDRMWIGRMQHDQLRSGGYGRDSFWGLGAITEEVDEYPPTHWMPLPDPPKEG